MNLFFGWLWVFWGFVSGTVLGMFFHGEGWLGGYGSLKRRMYRLGHISFFGLGIVNLMYALTIHGATAASQRGQLASWAFIAGGITMPACCVIMAHIPKAHMVFAVPVVCLLLAGLLTVLLVSG